MVKLPKSFGGLDAVTKAARDASKLHRDLERLGLRPGGVVARALEDQRRLDAAGPTDTASGALRRAMDVQREYERLGIEPRSTIARALDNEKRLAVNAGPATIADRYRSPMRDALDAIGNGTLARTLEAHRRFADMSGLPDAAKRALDTAALHVSSPAQQITGRMSTREDRTATPSGDAEPSSEALPEFEQPQGVRGEKPSSSAGRQRSPHTSIASVADIGDRVRAARRAMGMTQQRFADMAGVGRRFLIELEHGKASLEIGKVLAVCQAAGVELSFRE